MQTNGTQADGKLVMSPTANAETAPYTFQNIDNFGRFKVLKDKLCVLQNPNMAGTDTQHDSNGLVHNFKFTLKFRQPIKVRFNQVNGGSVADIIDNSLHFFANSDIPGANTKVNVAYLCRVCYKE